MMKVKLGLSGLDLPALVLSESDRRRSCWWSSLIELALANPPDF